MENVFGRGFDSHRFHQIKKLVNLLRLTSFFIWNNLIVLIYLLN